MIFTETKLRGAFLIEPELLRDERGFFARTYCEREFAACDLNVHWVQSSISLNEKKGTLRGMHWQAAPYAEAKLVRCTSGALYDAIIDLRVDSTTFKQWFAVELSAKNRLMLYIPEGLAHGFMILEDETEILYQMSEPFRPECARGLCWNDPAFAIHWPFKPTLISLRDLALPLWKDT